MAKDLGALLMNTAAATLSLPQLHLQVRPPLHRALPLLQRLLPSQKTAGRDAAERLGAARPQRRLLLVRAGHSKSHVCQKNCFDSVLFVLFLN